jgi:GR25 family glycosyltransferase involved in LPS biosynthesis
LKLNGIISIRSYSDLVSNRRESYGMSSLGAVGCTISHCEVWKKCIENNMPYITIVENDNIFTKKFTDSIIKRIVETITKHNGIFIGRNVDIRDNQKRVLGLNFYILNQGACKELVENCFPIDVQTDLYIAHLATIGKVYLDGLMIASQKNHKSNIQDMCILCQLPNNNTIYIIAGIVVGLMLIGLIVFIVLYVKCRRKS